MVQEKGFMPTKKKDITSYKILIIREKKSQLCHSESKNSFSLILNGKTKIMNS